MSHQSHSAEAKPIGDTQCSRDDQERTKSDSRFCVARAGLCVPSPYYETENVSLLHTLLYQNVDFVGDRGVNWNLGPGVLDSDHQAEWDRLYVAGPTFVTSLREGVVVLAEIFMVLRPLQRVVLHGATGAASDFGKPAGDTIKAKAMEGAVACYFRKPTEVKIANTVLGGYFRRLK